MMDTYILAHQIGVSAVFTHLCNIYLTNPVSTCEKDKNKQLHILTWVKKKVNDLRSCPKSSDVIVILSDVIVFISDVSYFMPHPSITGNF